MSPFNVPEDLPLQSRPLVLPACYTQINVYLVELVDRSQLETAVWTATLPSYAVLALPSPSGYELPTI